MSVDDGEAMFIREQPSAPAPPSTPTRRATSGPLVLPAKTAALLTDFSAASGALDLFDQKTAVERLARAAGHVLPLKLYVHSGLLSDVGRCFALACLLEDVRRGDVEAVLVARRGCLAPDARAAARVFRAFVEAGATIHEAIASRDPGKGRRRRVCGTPL